MAVSSDVGSDVGAGYIGRPLGFAETNCHLWISKERAGVYWHIGVLQTTDLLQESDVTKACKILMRKQEALHMRIVPSINGQGTASGFQFKPMRDPEKIDFVSTVIKNNTDWPAAISADHDKASFDTANGPLWGFILCHVETVENSEHFSYEYVILLKFHHSITDGKSAFDTLYRQYLPILSAVVNGGDAENIIPFVAQTKPVEELFLTPRVISNPVPWYIRLGLSLFRWKNRKFPAPEKPVYRFQDDTIPSQEEKGKEPQCVPKVFGEDICSSVLEAAKAHGVTVHCVFLTAGVVALSRTASAAGVEIPAEIKQAWPIDLRKYLDYNSPQPLGDIHAIGMTNHKRMTDCSLEEFWKACTDVSIAVKEQSEMKKCTKWLGIVDYFNDAIQRGEPFISIMKEMGMTLMISLSNLGNTSVGAQPKWTEGPQKIRLTQHFFSLTGISSLGFDAVGQYVLTYENKIMWNVIHNPNRHSRRFVETYLENLENVIRTYCTQQK